MMYQEYILLAIQGLMFSFVHCKRIKINAAIFDEYYPILTLSIMLTCDALNVI